MIEGGYHGVSDSVMWDIDLDEWDPTAGSPVLASSSLGVPKHNAEMLHLVPMNDASRLEDLLKAKHNDIGALLIEPILGNCCSIAATQEYINAVRSLCDLYNVVLIIDEVKTGFRVAKGWCYRNFMELRLIYARLLNQWLTVTQLLQFV